MNMIRILHVIGKMGMGGAETMIMNLYRNIDKEKVQFDFLVHTQENAYYDEEIKKLGGNIFRLPRFNGINFLAYSKSCEKFFKNDTEHKFVHGHIGSCAAIYLKKAKKYGKYCIVHSHNTKSNGLKGRLFDIYSYPTRKIADYFFGCSKQALIDRYGKKVLNKNYFVLNNAIDTKKHIFNQDIRYKTRQQLGILDDEFVIGHIGRFQEQKNHRFILEIFNGLIKHNNKAKLLLVGDGELRKSIEDKAKTLGLLDKIIFTGVRSDVPELLMAMDCFVFPSIYEGLGIVLIEAQASGLQCFASDAVPKEAKLTELVEFLSLHDGAEKWATNILKNKYDAHRKSRTEEIKQAGYDIKETANWLSKFYKERLIHD